METQEKPGRDTLRHRLIDAAEQRIGEQGLAGLKARQVTADAGCALGALYNAFADLDDLVLHVNARTLDRLAAAFAGAYRAGESAEETIAVLARTYVRFALENRLLWSAVFALALPEGRSAPDWYVVRYRALIDQIADPLAKLRPDLSPDELQLRARTLFAAVHGVVRLFLEARFLAVPQDRITPEVAALVKAMTRGLSAAE
ncbi:MAG: TetR/AcrR family transcriptional regulator [Rhodobacter sp.]|nr:TetR/AcrR family transcriptional regulator [Rhodobacter sp.]